MKGKIQSGIFPTFAWKGAPETGARTLCTTSHLKAVKMRKRFCKHFGHTKYPLLSEIALHVMSVHPISTATIPNWSIWGCVHNSAQNALVLERVKKMVTFCCNGRAKAVDQDGFGLLLSVVEGEVDEGTERDVEGAGVADVIEGHGADRGKVSTTIVGHTGNFVQGVLLQAL
jgi:hypothetical protein